LVKLCDFAVASSLRKRISTRGYVWAAGVYINVQRLCESFILDFLRA